MRRQFKILAGVCAVLIGLGCMAVFLGYLYTGLIKNYSRMRVDEAVDLYELEFPEMPAQAIPIQAPTHIYPAEDPSALKNPLEPSPEILRAGRQSYLYYCIHCHGPSGEGRGTVGQSFAPLPTDIKSPAVQQQTDGELFHKIGRGFKRHPPLAYTVSIEDRWAVVLYMRELSAQPAK